EAWDRGGTIEGRGPGRALASWAPAGKSRTDAGLLPEFPPTLAGCLLGSGSGAFSGAFESHRLLHRRLERSPEPQVFEELPLDRPGLRRLRISPEDVVHQGQPAPTRASREILPGRKKQVLVRPRGLLGAEHLRNGDAAAWACVIVSDAFVTALQAH